MELDGVWWSAVGDGPPVVVPRLNVDWTEVELDALAERFRVVVVAPRGFGPSARPGSYDGPGFVRDVEAVLDHLGIGTYATFGYSMNGVMAARLALDDPRVVAVACGGFPLTADLRGMGERAAARNAAARTDTQAWSEVLETYDPQAAVAFWQEVAALPRAALADLRCPLRVWWGGRDQLLASLLDPARLAADLQARGVPYDVVPDLDHDETLRRLDLVLPDVVQWLADQHPRLDPRRRAWPT